MAPWMITTRITVVRTESLGSPRGDRDAAASHELPLLCTSTSSKQVSTNLWIDQRRGGGNFPRDVVISSQVPAESKSDPPCASVYSRGISQQTGQY